MLELALEIVGFLAAATFIGLFFGYLVWGWGQRERIETARADGAARARTSVDGDAALEEKLHILTAERDKLKKSVASLKQDLASLKDAHPDEATKAPAPSEPKHAGSGTPGLRRSARFTAIAPAVSADDPPDGSDDAPDAAAPDAEAAAQDRTDAAQDRQDHTVPAFFGERSGRRLGERKLRREKDHDPADIEDAESVDIESDPAEASAQDTEDGSAPAGADDIESAINDILNTVRSDDGDASQPRSRLFSRSQGDGEDTGTGFEEGDLAEIYSDAADGEAPDPGGAASDDGEPDEDTEVDDVELDDVELDDAGVDDAYVATRPPAFFETAPEEIDDLKLIRGVGIKMETLLNEHGVYQYRQIAGFSEGDIDWLNTAIDAFPGRIRRDNWIGQATALNREKYGDEG